MFRQVLRPGPTFRSSLCSQHRVYSTPSETKVPIKLIADLRKQTHVSVSKARDALAATGNSIPAALEWLQKDLETTGLAKAAKVSNRETKHGLIAHAVLGHGASLTEVGGVRAAVVELGCETDFVAQNRLFAELAVDVAHTTAYMSESSIQGLAVSPAIPPVKKESPQAILALPIIQHPQSSEQRFAPGTTVASAIHATIVKVGENISLKRARTIVEENAPIAPPPEAREAFRVGSYLHGAKHGLPAAPLGALALYRLRSRKLGMLLRDKELQKDLFALERAVAQQIAGMNTLSVHPKPEHENPEDALYNQQFFTLPSIQGMTVRDALKAWSTQKGFIEVEDPIKSFAEGYMKYERTEYAKKSGGKQVEEDKDPNDYDFEEGIDVLTFLRWEVGGSEK